jgi:hypothetical protein
MYCRHRPKSRLQIIRECVHNCHGNHGGWAQWSLSNSSTDSHEWSLSNPSTDCHEWSRRGEAGHREPATLDTEIVEVASASRGWPWKAAGCQSWLPMEGCWLPVVAGHGRLLVASRGWPWKAAGCQSWLAMEGCWLLQLRVNLLRASCTTLSSLPTSSTRSTSQPAGS